MCRFQIGIHLAQEYCTWTMIYRLLKNDVINLLTTFDQLNADGTAVPSESLVEDACGIVHF